MGWYGFQILVLLSRGPHCNRSTWFGYEGGIEPRKSVVDARLKSRASVRDVESGKDEQRDSFVPQEKEKEADASSPSTAGPTK